jgi:cation transporter-like permease
MITDAPSNNPIALSNLYPGAGGSTTSQAGSAMSTGTTNDTSETAPALNMLERNFSKSLLGEPVKAWIALAVLLFGGMYLATRFRGSAAAANVKFSLYNIVAIVVLGIVGGAIAKVLAARFPIPGISTIILAS